MVRSKHVFLKVFFLMVGVQVGVEILKDNHHMLTELKTVSFKHNSFRTFEVFS